MKQFYTNLYSSSHPDTECADFQALLNIENLLVLSETDKQCCEGDVTIEECKSALDRMQIGKSPGCDGLTVEFYKAFWPIIGNILVEVLNFSSTKGELSPSQKRGVITLLQKRGKDPTLIKNWRPVSLTNVDYKILTKSLAIRMEKSFT